MKKVILIVTLTSILIIALLMLGCESAYIKGAKLYIGQSNWEKAREQLDMNIKTYPKDPVSFYWLGMIDARESKWDDMLANWDKCLSMSKVLEKDIESMKQQYFNDFLNQGINKYNDAVKLFKDKDVKEDEVKSILNQVVATQVVALKIYPNNDKPGEILSRAFLLMGERDKAREVFEQLLATNQNHEASLSTLGNMYFEDGLMNKDNQLLKKSIELNERLIGFRPDNPRALKDLALAYYQLGDSVKALSIFKLAYEKNPTDIDIIVNYGKILYETGTREQAESMFKKSLELAPDNKTALRTLSRFYVVDIKDFERGLELLNKLVQFEPDNPNLWELIGICQANLQNKEAAEKAFEKAKSLQKSTP